MGEILINFQAGKTIALKDYRREELIVEFGVRPLPLVLGFLAAFDQKKIDPEDDEQEQDQKDKQCLQYVYEHLSFSV